MPFDVTVTALDAYGNVVTNYQGTITLTTTDPDPGVVLPASYTFTAADAGVHTFMHPVFEQFQPWPRTAHKPCSGPSARAHA